MFVLFCFAFIDYTTTVLAQTGFLKKYAVYFRGKRFLWGKAEVTVCQVYAPAPIATSANDFTRRLLSPDW